MENPNELNDIILNKGSATSSNKKIILAVATLGVILIIVVMLMNSLSSNGTDNLPKAALPPEPDIQSSIQEVNEPLFEDVQVIQEDAQEDADLEAIAKKLKQESNMQEEEEEITVVQKVQTPKPVVKKHIVKKPVAKKVITPTHKKVTAKKTKHVAIGSYYIQVGSFSKYAPNKKFLKSIKNLGYNYIYHKVTVNYKTLNKVLVGPFSTHTKAKQARRKIRAKIEPGAFLVKL